MCLWHIAHTFLAQPPITILLFALFSGMGYLRLRDYSKQIQDSLLSQVLGNDDSIRTLTEAAAVSEARSYLVQKYYLNIELTDTNPYSATQAYLAGQRAELNFPPFSASSAYAVGNLVIYNGEAFQCSATVTTPGAFNPADWMLLGNQYDVYYAQYPQPVFNIYGCYQAGDQVFWNNKVYTCVLPSVFLDHDDVLQRSKTYNIPLPNIFPDDPVNGATYWGEGIAYSVPVGTLPTNTTYWTLGDNRCQQLVQLVTDISLYHLHSRISPVNIPELRNSRYRAAIDLLKMAATGDITFDLAQLQPRQGSRIRFGSNIKNTNSY